MDYDDTFLTYEEFTDKFGSNKMEFNYQLFNETFLEDVNEMIQESVNYSGGLAVYETSPMRERIYYELFGDKPGIRLSGIRDGRGKIDMMYLDILLKDKKGNIHLFSPKITGRGDEWKKDIVISSGENEFSFDNPIYILSKPERIIEVNLTDVNTSLELTTTQRKVKVYNLEKFPLIKGMNELTYGGMLIQEIYNAASDYPQTSFFEVDFVIDIMPFEERPREGTNFMNWIANPLNS